jgi:hypothetical protein
MRTGIHRPDIVEGSGYGTRLVNTPPSYVGASLLGMGRHTVVLGCPTEG